jgi:hypothetical protein
MPTIINKTITPTAPTTIATDIATRVSASEAAQTFAVRPFLLQRIVPLSAPRALARDLIAAGTRTPIPELPMPIPASV